MDVELKIKELDQLRLIHLSKLIKSKTYYEDVKHYLRFINQTHHSLKYLEKINKKNYPKLHSELIRKKVKQIIFIRKQEIKLIANIITKKGIFGRVLVNNFLRSLSEILLKRYVLVEIDYAHVIVKVVQSNEKEVQQIHKMMCWEERKRYAYLLISSFFWLIPFLGTILFVSSSLFLNALNRLTPHHKRLMQKLE